MAHLPRAPPTAGLHTASWATKLGLLTAGAASLVGIARLAVPPLVALISASFPSLWATLRVWLAPPYLFLTVNLIILVIWKLSDRKHHHHHHQHDHNHWVLPPAPEEEPFKPAKAHLSRNPTPELWGDSSPAPATPPRDAEVDPGGSSPSDESCVTAADPDEGSTASSRVGMIKSVKPPPAGVKLEEEAEGERDDSLDATWKTIMVRPPLLPAPAPTPAAPPEQPSDESAAAADELNRRFEDFIKKNRDQIRLQREEWNQSRRSGDLDRELY